jgi:hypothetical protein
MGEGDGRSLSMSRGSWLLFWPQLRLAFTERSRGAAFIVHSAARAKSRAVRVHRLFEMKTTQSHSLSGSLSLLNQ